MEFFAAAALSPDVINLAVYMSGEIIMLTINSVFKSLKTGMMDLPDIAVQSHHVMLAVEETSFSILYAMNNEFMDSDQLEKCRFVETFDLPFRPYTF